MRCHSWISSVNLSCIVRIRVSFVRFNCRIVAFCSRFALSCCFLFVVWVLFLCFRFSFHSFHIFFGCVRFIFSPVCAVSHFKKIKKKKMRQLPGEKCRPSFTCPPTTKKKKKKKKKPTKEFDGGWLQSKKTEQESMRGPFELNMTFIKGGGGGGLCVPGVFTELVARAAAPPHWCLLAIKRARVSSEI